MSSRSARSIGSPSLIFVLPALPGRHVPTAVRGRRRDSALRTVSAPSPGCLSNSAQDQAQWGISDIANPKKKIRAAHAKEKQQIQSTCGYPNRLNLTPLTAVFSAPFEISRAFTKKIWLL